MGTWWQHKEDKGGNTAGIKAVGNGTGYPRTNKSEEKPRKKTRHVFGIKTSVKQKCILTFARLRGPEDAVSSVGRRGSMNVVLRVEWSMKYI